MESIGLQGFVIHNIFLIYSEIFLLLVGQIHCFEFSRKKCDNAMTGGVGRMD